MIIKTRDAAVDIFINGCHVEFFETLNGITNLHSFVLSRGKVTSKANNSRGDKRKIAANSGVSAENSGNVWYGSCKYPNFG